MCAIKSLFLEQFAAVKVSVIKTNNASTTDHKPPDIVSPAWSQDTVALRGVIKKDGAEGARDEPFQRAVC